jgi:hypothetical protein
MAAGKCTIEGSFVASLNNIVCICGHCGNHANENTQIEFNFREKKIFFVCNAEGCKKMNILDFSHKPVPYPKSRTGRL